MEQVVKEADKAPVEVEVDPGYIGKGPDVPYGARKGFVQGFPPRRPYLDSTVQGPPVTTPTTT